MSQSLLYHAFGVREGYEYVRTEYHQGGSSSPGCANRIAGVSALPRAEIVRKGKRFRRIQTVPIGLKPVFLKTEVPRCECKACGQVFEVSPPLPRPMSTTPND